MIRVLLVDDSEARVREIELLLGTAGGLRVTGSARNRTEARDALRRGSVDLVAVHTSLKSSDPFLLVTEIMVHVPIPTVMICDEPAVTVPALSRCAIDAGALALLSRPPSAAAGADRALVQTFVASLSALAAVKVVGHRLRVRSNREPALERLAPSVAHAQVIAIAASTGGPSAIRQVLCGFPANFPMPVLVVQHLTRGFAGEFVRWLGDHLAMAVTTARSGEKLAAGTVYIAPEDRHLMVAHGRELVTGDGPLVAGFRPAGSVLFESVARVFGAGTVAVVLSGMGRDGVTGLSHVRSAGGRVIVQDEESSVVFGMPGAAIEAGLVDHVLPIHAIGPTLLTLSSRNRA